MLETEQEIMKLQFYSLEMVDLSSFVQLPAGYNVRGIPTAGFTGFHQACGRYFEVDKPPTRELVSNAIREHTANCPSK